MKKTLFIVFCLLFTAAAVAQTVPNGDFEAWASDNATGWTEDTGISDSQDSSTVHGGTYSSKLTITTQTQGDCDYESDFITISPDTAYAVSAWVFDNDIQGDLRLAITWFDGTDTYISNAYGVYSSDSASWQELTNTWTSPSTAAKAKVKVRGYDDSTNWVSEAIFYLDDFTIAEDTSGPTIVPNIAGALALSDGATVTISGAVTLGSDYGGLGSYGNQFAVQDKSGTDGQSGIVIIDPANNITDSSGYVVGATLTNVTGTLGSYNGLRQIELSADPGTPGTGTVPTPINVTLPVADVDAIQGELIVLLDLTTLESGTWAVSTNYTVSQGVNDAIARVEVGSTLAGETIPAGTFAMVGIAWTYNGFEIEPRYPSDVSAPVSGVSDWTLY